MSCESNLVRWSAFLINAFEVLRSSYFLANIADHDRRPIDRSIARFYFSVAM